MVASVAVSGSVPKPAVFGRWHWLIAAVRITGATLAVVAVFICIGVPWWVSHPDRFGQILGGLLSDFDGRVTFDRVRLGWTGPMLLEGIRIVPADGSEPPIVVARVEGNHGLLAMLASGGDLGRLTVDGLTLDIAIEEGQGTNLRRLFPSREPQVDESRPPEPRRTPLRMRVDVEDVVVRISSPWTPEPWISDPIAFRASLAPTEDGSYSEWTIAPVQLLSDTRLELPVAAGVLSFVAPVFADATRATGRFSLSLDGGKLPVGAPGSGTVSGVLSMHEVVVGPGPFVTSLAGALPVWLSASQPTPTIRIADESHVKFRLADRKVWHEGLEFGVPLPLEGRRLDVTSSGSVALDDRALDIRVTLPIPADLPQDRPLLAALAGKTVSVGVEGNLDEPKIVLDGSLGLVAGQAAIGLWTKVPALLERVRGEQPIEEPSSSPSEQAAVPAGNASPPDSGDVIVKILGGVIDEVARRRAERREAEEAEEAPPPRRGRLRDRLFRP